MANHESDSEMKKMISKLLTKNCKKLNSKIDSKEVNQRSWFLSILMKKIGFKTNKLAELETMRSWFLKKCSPIRWIQNVNVLKTWRKLY